MKNIYTKCPMCGKESTFTVTDEQYDKYINKKENIQCIFPELSCEEREMLITGICGDCWDKIFKDEEIVGIKYLKMKNKNYYLVLDNSTSDEIDELPIDVVNSITPAIDKYGKPGLLISYYDDEFCCDCTLACDSIESIREEEIKL